MLKIEITCREIIKPSSSHPPTYQLSLIDQFLPPYYIPVVLHYPFPQSLIPSQPTISSILKRSLSEALSLYYPIAGTMSGDSSVDCNDHGVLYIESRVHATHYELIDTLRLDALKQLVPCAGEVTAGGQQLAIQANFFTDGGIAIGVCISHRIGDAASLSSFLNAWATATRGGIAPAPSFVASDLFPPREPFEYNPRTQDPTPNNRLVEKKLRFGAAKLATLRENVSGSGSCLVRPTRVEMVTALIWSALAREGDAVVVAHMVNLRVRLEPPLQENAFGNIFRPALVTGAGCEAELGGLVGKLRDGIKSINKEYIEKFRETGYEESMNNIKGREKKGSDKGVKKVVSFSSWCRFPYYEADFGWGKPSWVSGSGLALRNSVILMDSMEEGGMEAWVTMEEEDMKKLGQDTQLSAFASIT